MLGSGGWVWGVVGCGPRVEGIVQFIKTKNGGGSGGCEPRLKVLYNINEKKTGVGVTQE